MICIKVGKQETLYFIEKDKFPQVGEERTLDSRGYIPNMSIGKPSN